jgi:leucyl aminopeptidase
VGRAAARAAAPARDQLGQSRSTRASPIVGKGVCFDTGGLDIKTAEGMRLMKKDMGGAAHAIALARLIMQRKLPVRLQMLVPAVENAIAATPIARRRVRTRKGLTIEIGNTDAEGRVILCDALAYAVEQKPKTIIDFATLTGAARVALGPELPALFATTRSSPRAARRAERRDDPMWRMPLWRNYRRLFDSDDRRLQQLRPRRLRGADRGGALPRLLRAREDRLGALRRVRVERRERPGAAAGRRGAGPARGAGGDRPLDGMRHRNFSASAGL